MAKISSRDEIRAIAAPLWLLVNAVDWYSESGAFDIVKCGAMAIVSQIAYCAIDADESKRTARAKVIPCMTYQRLLASGPVDVADAMASVDIPGVRVLRTRYFVMTVMPVRDRYFVGVRGTQDGHDWLINIHATKRTLAGGLRFHAGFLGEALKLGAALKDYLAERSEGTRGADVHFAGHSLGGAVAALLSCTARVMPHAVFPDPGFRSRDAYTFGMPRVASRRTAKLIELPHMIRRRNDIVPHCPPRFMNFAEPPDVRAPDGAGFESDDANELFYFASWLASLKLGKFLDAHAMENYRREVLEVSRKQPRVAEYWNYPL